MRICVSAVASAAAVLALAGAADATFDSILNFGYDTAQNNANTNGQGGFFQEDTPGAPPAGTDVTPGMAPDNIITGGAANGVWNNEFVSHNADNFARSTFIAVDNRHTDDWLVNDGSFLPGGPDIVSGVWSNVSTGSFGPGDSSIGGPGVGTAIGFGALGVFYDTDVIDVGTGQTHNGIFASRFVVDAGAMVTGAAGATIRFTGSDAGGETLSFPFPANGRSGFGPAVDANGTAIGAFFALQEGGGPDGRDIIDLYILDNVPSPGAAALLGIAGLAGTRRRR